VRITIDDFTTLATSNRTFVKGQPALLRCLFNGGVIIEPWPGIRAYASYAEGFTVPDVGRVTRAINKPGIAIDTYLNIRPIVSNNREIGIEVSAARWMAASPTSGRPARRGSFSSSGRTGSSTCSASASRSRGWS
jgi:iron complex outermembrane receptor protein